MNNVKRLYEQLGQLPWPALAACVGDFALYESLLVGCADRVAKGHLLDMSKIPAPDQGTVDAVSALRKRPVPTEEEQRFLEYYDLLEQIRVALVSGS